MGSEGIGLQEANDLFKRGWGNYPTGVSVITTGKEENEIYGMTAIRVMYCSENPPMVLMLLGRLRQTYDNLEKYQRFGLNILAGNQSAWADFCARPPEQRGWNVPDGYTFSKNGTPLIPGSLVSFDCKVVAKYELKPEVLMYVGEVESIDPTDGLPMIFFRGEYLDVGYVEDEEE